MAKINSFPIKQVIASALMLAVALTISVLLVINRGETAVRPPLQLDPLVNVLSVKRKDAPLVIKGFGTVVPQVEIDLISEVSGRVVAVSSALKTGGQFSQDEILITIEPEDYQLAVEKAKSGIAQAQLQLDIELAEANVKRREREAWRRSNPSKRAPALALHEQQVKQAKASLRAAKVSLQQAELNLKRTRLSLPFAGRVMSESVDVGQYVAAGQSLGRVYGLSALEVKLPLADSKLAHFRLASESPVSPSRVNVTADFAGRKQLWRGFVDRIEGVVDNKTRLVNVVIVVPNTPAAPQSESLLPGMFVNVAIEGQLLPGVIAVPRNAVREKGTVWSVKNDILMIKEVEILHNDQDFSYIGSGLEEGDQVVTSLLGVVTDRMRVRINLKDYENNEIHTASEPFTDAPKVSELQSSSSDSTMVNSIP